MQAGERFGEYVLVRRLGAGGQGEVFEARDPIGMFWALKIGHRLHTDDDAALARFAREAQWVNATLGSLPRNTGVLVGEHYGVHDQRFYVKMRLVRGESLAHRLKRAGRLPLVDAITIAKRVALIVAVAHEHNAIHRDLKPENVLLEGEDRIQVVDWGCMHLVQAGQLATSGTGPLCTLGYAAPEQYRLEHPPTPATDIYALGVMLFEMLTGNNPFLDSWRSDKLRKGGETRGPGMTRTAVRFDSNEGGETGLYPTAQVRNIRPAASDAITRVTAPTDVLSLEERLKEPRASSESALGHEDPFEPLAEFRPTSVSDVLRRQLTFELLRFRPAMDHVPTPILVLLAEMLDPDPKKRPSTMTHVAQRLSVEPSMSEVNVHLEPAPRNRWGLAFLSSVLLLLAFVGWWSMSSDGLDARDVATASTEQNEASVDRTQSASTTPIAPNPEEPSAAPLKSVHEPLSTAAGSSAVPTSTGSRPRAASSVSRARARSSAATEASGATVAPNVPLVDVPYFDAPSLSATGSR